MEIKCINPDDLDREIQKIENLGYKEHHTAMTGGYISRRLAGVIKEYHGQYGHGYTVHEPSFQGTKFHRVTYFVV